ncbi:MAG: hypothetical protein ACQEUM_16130 [Pseudomonadota bacterium]
MNDAVERYVETHSKSQFLGFFLTLIFGPLGLFYSSWVAALILCVIAVLSAGSIIGPIICWLLAILISFFAVSKHNDKVKAAAALGVRK